MEENNPNKNAGKKRYHNNRHHRNPKDGQEAVSRETAPEKKELRPNETQDVASSGEKHPKNNRQGRNHRNNRRKNNQQKPKENEHLNVIHTVEELEPIIAAEPLPKIGDDRFSDEDDDAISLSPDELEDIENQRELMYVDGATDIDLMAEENESASDPKDEGIRYEVIGVRFGSASKVYYFDPDGKSVSVGKGVVVETARGNKYGLCTLANRTVPADHVFLPLKKVLKIADEEDRRINEENIKMADEAFKQCNIKIREHGLEMKLIDAAYTHDREKLVFFFTAPTRVDFRELVKDLASLFKTRIDLRQIGIRDEAKMIGGYGVCGRPLCCCGFLPNFNQVSIKMAKEQNLSLNTSKISGVCGRLMCCLKFEHKTYLDEAKLLPPIGSCVKTPDGTGVVIEHAPISGAVKVRPNDGRDPIQKLYSKNDITVIRRSSEQREAPDFEDDSDS